MFDTQFIGCGTFYELNEFSELANKFGYKGSKRWRLPKWEELKQAHPHDWGDYLGELWTDNATSASFTAKRMKLSTGEFMECNQKFHYEEKAFLRLVCDEVFQDVSCNIQSHDGLQFMVLPFGEMNYGAVDTMNELLTNIQFAGMSAYRRPTIEELEALLPIGREIFGMPEGWYWSSSQGGKFNAFKVNFWTKEKYSCKKSSDYSESKAYSLAIVE
ncbi:MAG: DUF1566 domain-containing protein [Cryomorphaceae bacterium]|jgi:hypothetical protein|nr:DUF1566 domain-containing protein [Cryomorphaceae bacterium]